MAKKAREDDPNAKEDTDQRGHGGSLFRDTTVGAIVRLVTGNKVLQYPEERNPEFFRKKYSTEAMDEKQRKVDQANRKSEERWRRENPEDAARETRASSQSTLNGSPDRKETEGSEESDNEKSKKRAHHDTERGKDVNLVKFEPNDPENPMNWSLGKKCFTTGMICLLTFSIYVGSAIYSPGVVSVEESFGVSEVVAVLGLSAFVAGYGLGPMLWSPLSEIPSIGRNPIYIGTLIVFVAIQVPTARCGGMGALIPLRFVAGFFGSPALATGGASISDIFTPKYRAHGIAIWGVTAVCGPVLGPLMGGFIVDWRDRLGYVDGWRWTIWELLWLSGLGLAILVFTLPETSTPCILYYKAKRLRKITGNQKLQSESEIMQKEMTWGAMVKNSLLFPFVLCFTEPIVFLLNLYIALIYGILYIFFEAYAIVFVGIYGFNEGELGLSFIGVFVGAVLALIGFEIYLKVHLEKKFDEAEDGMIAPEQRLPPAMLGAFFIPICLFWFGWTARAEIHWIVPIISTSFFGAGTFLLFQSILNYLPDAYPSRAASVLAGNDLFRSAFGAGFPVFASAMYMNEGIGVASSILGGLATIMIPLPFIFYKYGAQVRKWSKHAG